jgi:hypothetical protein
VTPSVKAAGSVPGVCLQTIVSRSQEGQQSGCEVGARDIADPGGSRWGEVT